MQLTVCRLNCRPNSIQRQFVQREFDFGRSKSGFCGMTVARDFYDLSRELGAVEDETGSVAVVGRELC